MEKTSSMVHCWFRMKTLEPKAVKGECVGKEIGGPCRQEMVQDVAGMSWSH